jgi:hypothetical protein
MKTTQLVTNSSNHPSSTARQEKQAALKISIRSAVMAASSLLSALLPVSQTAGAQIDLDRPFVAPVVFQAAGPTAASIQSTVDAFRAALGDPVNGNNPGPLMNGRREINWDGGNPGNTTTTAPVTPFDVFLNTRGARFTTPGLGLSQAAPAGLAVLFNNPTYAGIFTVFSPSRLFTPVASNTTNGSFFVPGTNAASPATVTGFGAVFTDVDSPDGGTSKPRTLIEYFDVYGHRIFKGIVPASPGDGSLSFIGIKFQDARIASVRITTNDAPGANDDGAHDIVMMDDFIYGEPQPLRFGGFVALPSLTEGEISQ